MLHVNNEFGHLHKVLMASVETFHLHEPINSTQEYYYKYDPPIMEKLLDEQANFVSVLTKYGVEIVWAEKRYDCTNQLNTRDVAFVIGNTFVVCPMRKKERQNEHLSLERVIRSFKNNDKVLRPTAGFIEGGDIILDGTKMFVGISQRTNKEGLQWLKDSFSTEYTIVPVYLTPKYLHLDCVFNLLSESTALVQREGISDESFEKVSKLYDIVYADLSEQIALPTNVFSINSKTVVADIRNKVTNERIRESGKDVIEIDFFEMSKIGGSFRCCTCPLERDDV